MSMLTPSLFPCSACIYPGPALSASEPGWRTQKTWCQVRAPPAGATRDACADRALSPGTRSPPAPGKDTGKSRPCDVVLDAPVALPGRGYTATRAHLLYRVHCPVQTDANVLNRKE